MAQVGEGTKNSLEKIKKQLDSASGSVLLQGTLLKRSETLRKWNQRWFTLDPATGKFEYRSQRGDATPRGLITFDPDSTVTVLPLNIQGNQKYDGCCFYIGTPQKQEYFLCAETAAAARAWVATLRAAALVLRAHKEAVNSLSGNGRAKLGTVAAVVAAANATARDAAKDLQMAMKIAAVPSSAPQPSDAGNMDDVTVMKETLRVKDEELNQLARDLRARDLTIKELADRLSQTADAAESAASAVHAIDKERKLALSESEHLRNELRRAAQEMRAAEERVAAALNAKESAMQEAHRWRMELGKAREHCVLLEATVRRADEGAQQLKLAHDHELAECWQAQEARTGATPAVMEADDLRSPASMVDAGKESGIALQTQSSECSRAAPEVCGSVAPLVAANDEVGSESLGVVADPATKAMLVPSERNGLLNSPSTEQQESVITQEKQKQESK